MTMHVRQQQLQQPKPNANDIIIAVRRKLSTATQCWPKSPQVSMQLHSEGDFLNRLACLSAKRRHNVASLVGWFEVNMKKSNEAEAEAEAVMGTWE